MEHWQKPKATLPENTAVVIICRDACQSNLVDVAQRLAREADVPILYGESNAWTRIGSQLDARGFHELPPRAQSLEAIVAASTPTPQPSPPPDYPAWYSQSLRDAIEMLRTEMQAANLTSITLTEKDFEYERVEIVRGKF